MKKKILYIFNWILLTGSTVIVTLFLGVILFDIFSKGLSSVSWSFISKFPGNGMTTGGILPAIIGTFLLTIVTTLFAVPFGVTCAIYLNEYAKPSLLTNIIRASIRNLAGIPSIIYGLFGLALFVQSLRMGTSVLSAGLTLGLLSLPYIITTTEEALKRIPNSMREATLALGATQFETIRDVVLPKSLPGILTGVILTLSRAAGETAPILFTGVAFYINTLTASLNQEFMALPYHLYMLSTQHNSIETVRPLAYGTSVVLILLVFTMNIVAFYIRFKHRTQE
ncbi:MAG: phosphate ABC transporter permease PstA [Taibaiella sp.]|nr:phosphate ABC transporter permease PstA [Taibaiella sp.]